tara:strand:+ start:97 stop:297 length:201 start_codon:yes stop_codon:yes gene_type:complete
MHLTEDDLRMFRNAALEESDWTQMSDSPLSDTKKTEWATYRQALRDLTNHTDWPEVTLDDFPEEPS